MTFLRPLSKRGLAALQATHVQEQDPFDDQGALLDMYLAFKTLAQGELSPTERFQFNFASKDRFLGRAVCRPRPPWSVGRVTTSQLTKCNLHFSEEDSQRKLQLARSIS